jgi:predicted nucleotidyltransferase
MSPFIYNGLLKTYSAAVKIDDVREDHIDQWIEDAWELMERIEADGYKFNSEILNTMVLLHCNALRGEDLETKVLPLYLKHKISYDVYTYQHIIRHFLKIRELN